LLVAAIGVSKRYTLLVVAEKKLTLRIGGRGVAVVGWAISKIGVNRLGVPLHSSSEGVEGGVSGGGRDILDYATANNFVR